MCDEAFRESGQKGRKTRFGELSQEMSMNHPGGNKESLDLSTQVSLIAVEDERKGEREAKEDIELLLPSVWIIMI